MLNVLNLELDFDITSPLDVMRYKKAGEHMDTEAANIKDPILPEDDPAYLDEYCDFLNAQLRLYGNFLDDVFGDGTAEKLLSKNPSLNKVYEVADALASAMEAQGKEFGVKLNKYKPNRATRRAGK